MILYIHIIYHFEAIAINVLNFGIARVDGIFPYK
jgi:hypothetical protein